MRSPTRRLALLLSTATLLSTWATGAVAQAYPNRPVRLIVPFAAGGGTDFFARTVGQKLAENMGQTIVVDNKPGAGTIIGTDAAAKSPGDGYTVLLADSSSLVLNPSLYSKLPYDVDKDFAAVAVTARFAMILVVNPNASKSSNLKELIEEMKKADGKMNYASVGAGSLSHLTMELFQRQIGVKLTHIAYKGAGPAMLDVVGGQVPMMVVDLAAGAPMIKSGKLKPLAVASAKRISALPDVPTFTEQGVPNFETWAWQALVVPAATPKEIVAKINTDYIKTINDVSVQQKLADSGVELVTTTPAEAAAYFKSEAAKWSTVIKQANIKLE